MVAASPLFLLGDARRWYLSQQSLVTSTIRGKESSHMRRNHLTCEGIISHAWHEILRLSSHLFWLGGFTHRAFSSVQDDDTGERKGFHLGDTLRVLELAVLYTIRVGPWRRAAPKAQDGSTKRCERLCEAIRFP